MRTRISSKRKRGNQSKTGIQGKEGCERRNRDIQSKVHD